jgi:WD40 repeat protein
VGKRHADDVTLTYTDINRDEEKAMVQRFFSKHFAGKVWSLTLAMIAILVLCLAFVPVQAQASREILRLGRGTANALDWRPDGKVLAVGSATGIWLLDEALNIIDHQEPIESVRDIKWSPDGLQIAITDATGEACHTQIWDAEFSHKQADINFCGVELKWSPDGSRLAVLHEHEASIALIDTSRGAQIATLIGQSGVWSPDSTIFVTSAFSTPWYAGEPSIYVWNSQTGQQKHQIAHDTYGFGELLWSTETEHVAIWCNEEITHNDNLININICELNVRTGKISPAIKLTSTHIGDSVFITQPQWNNSHDYIAYILTRQTRGFLDLINLFDQRTGELTYVGDGYAFDWKSDENIVTSIVGNGFIQNIDAITAKVLQEQMIFTAPVSSIAWRPNGEQIASVAFGYEQDARVWDATQSAYEPELMWHAEPAEKVFYTSDNNEVVTAGTIYTDIIINHDISAWDADTGERSRGINGFYSQFDPFPLVAWNKDFTRSIQSDRDDKVQISENLTITTKGSETFGIVWSPDETKVATVSKSCGDCGFIIETWDIETGERINTIEGFQQYFDQLLWSPDSNMMAVLSLWNPMGGEDRRVSFYGIKKGKDYCCNQSDSEYFDPVDYPADVPFRPIRMSWKADSSQIALSFQESTNIYRIAGGENILTLPVTGVGSLEWSPDGTMLALGMNDGTIRIWDVSDLDGQ